MTITSLAKELGLVLDDTGRGVLSATQALAYLPLLQRLRDREAGLNTAGYISGYRGSPLGGYDQELWRLRDVLGRHDVRFQPGVNEDLAATAIWGTQQIGLFGPSTVDGVFALWYGKGPGVDRSGDALKHGSLAGTSKLGGVLVAAGDDHGCKSSSNAHQSDQALVAALTPYLYPATVEEILSLGLAGWAMSRYSGCWIGLKCVADVAESTQTTRLDFPLPLVPGAGDFAFPVDGVHIRWPEDFLAQEARHIQVRLRAAQAFARVNGLDRATHRPTRPRLGIVTSGKAWLDVVDALTLLGLDDRAIDQLGIGIYKVAMPWPLEPEGIRAFVSDFQTLLVVEEKRAIIEDQLARLLIAERSASTPELLGKTGRDGRPFVPEHGELSAAEVARLLAGELDRLAPDARFSIRASALLPEPDNASGGIVKRSPWFCAGCPHNSSTKVPEGSSAVAGIGCHSMALSMKRRTSGFTHMGAEGANWIGLAPYSTTRHIFQNLGDGTYFHSGILAVRAAVAAGVNITYKLLYNDAVAMTGGQPVEGNLLPWQIVHQLLAEGVARVAVVADDPGKYPPNTDWGRGVRVHPREALDQVQRELRDVPGVTVLLYDQVCAAEKRRRAKRRAAAPRETRAFINDRVCEGCGDCGRVSNCVAIRPVSNGFDRARRVDQGACNTDLSCVGGFCPSFVTVVGGRRRSVGPGASPKLAAVPEQAPVKPIRADAPWNLLLAGIGGTGVTTLAGLLAVAAQLDGRSCAVLNQTGLAQKNGAVVSHIRIGARLSDLRAGRVPARAADLVIAADALVAAGADISRLVSRDGTDVVANASIDPVASFALTPDNAVKSDQVFSRLQALVGSTRLSRIDAGRLARDTFGDAVYANLILLGFAAQKGLLPLSCDSIVAAIGRLPGAERNGAAFALGRSAAESATPQEPLAGRDEPLHALVARRALELEAYQDSGYAERYRRAVAVAEQADTLAGQETRAFTRVVAQQLFRLLAYKDEYEVARLYANGEFERKLAAEFEGRPRLVFHLAPPLLPFRDAATGRPRKLSFGPWVLPAFRALSKLKALRGTMFDPFGHTRERRLERQHVKEYEALVYRLAAQLHDDSYTAAVELAGYPDAIRGYGPVKEAATKAALRRRDVLESRFFKPATAQTHVSP